MRARPSLLALLLVAACVPQAPQPAPRPPRIQPQPPAPPPAAAPAADWRDWPLTPGTWRYRRDARGSSASFGLSPATARLILRCEAATRRIELIRTGATASTLTVRTSSTARTLAAQPVPGETPAAVATLAATDPLFDAMGFSRGRFVIDQPGSPPLVVPAWAEIERVTEDCRG